MKDFRIIISYFHKKMVGQKKKDLQFKPVPKGETTFEPHIVPCRDTDVQGPCNHSL